MQNCVAYFGAGFKSNFTTRVAKGVKQIEKTEVDWKNFEKS